ncbi:MAG: PQQ-binding-like beta-propeller repeat protein [Planctomycetota bacterium]
MFGIARSYVHCCLIVAVWTTFFSSTLVAQESGIESLWTREGQDWPRFLGPNINGISTETGIKTDWSKGNVDVRWTIESGEGYGMGVVSKGRFFHFGKYDDEAILKCVHAETGKLLWEFKYQSEYRDLYNYDSGPRSSPLVDGDRVYIFGVEGMLHCIDVKTGQAIWKIDTAKRFGVIQNFFGVGSTPLVYDDKLLVMVGGSPEESKQVPPGQLNRVKPNNCGIVAFNKFTGKLQYQSIDDLASYSSLQLMERDGNAVVLAFMRERLHGFDPNNGKEKFSLPWRARRMETVNAMTPVVIGSKLFISESYELGANCLDASKDELVELWSDGRKRNQAMATHWNTPVLSGDYLYGCSGEKSSSAEVRCLEWKTGKVTWAQRGFGRASVIKVGEYLVLLGERGELKLIKDDSTGFNVVTTFESAEGDSLGLRAPCWAAPIYSHGYLYVRGANKVVCLDLKK